MDKKMLNAIMEVKRKYEGEGFIILGVFGSFARGEDDKGSDVDILFSCSEDSFVKYPGLRFFALYERVKNDLEHALNRKVELADRNGLSEIGKKYILPEVVYVS